MSLNDFLDLTSICHSSEFKRVITAYVNIPRIFTYFIKKISFSLLYTGENRSRFKWLSQNHRINVAKPFPTLTCLCDFKAQIFPTIWYIASSSRRTSQKTHVTYRESVILELGNSESPTFNQPGLEVPWIAECVTAFIPFTNLKSYFKLYYIVEKELSPLTVPGNAL